MEMRYPNKIQSKLSPPEPSAPDNQVSDEELLPSQVKTEPIGKTEGGRIVPTKGTLLWQAFFLSLLTPNVATSCWESCDNFFLILPLYVHLLLIPFSWPLFGAKIALFYVGLSKIRDRNMPKKQANWAVLLLAVGISALVVFYYWSFTEEGRASLINLAASQTETKSGVFRVLDFFGDAQKAGLSTSNGYYQQEYPLKVGFYCLNDCVINWPGGAVFCFSNEKVIYSAESQSANYSLSLSQEFSTLPKCNGDFSTSCNAEEDMKSGKSSGCYPSKQSVPTPTPSLTGIDQKVSNNLQQLEATMSTAIVTDVVSGDLVTTDFETDLASVWGLPVKVAGRVIRTVKLVPASGSDSVKLKVCDESGCLPEHSVIVGEGEAVVAIDIEFVNKNQSTGDDIRDRANSSGNEIRFRTENEYWPARTLIYKNGYWYEWSSQFSVGLDKPTRMTFWTRAPAETREVEFVHWPVKRIAYGSQENEFTIIPDFSSPPAFSFKMQFDR